ncbi:Hypothetical protein RAK1035_3653 [Roseovarius sp. AK1035]|nr:Hypothetical protein RAK1035_3653 [Roseovarius sp. AK1035]
MGGEPGHLFNIWNGYKIHSPHATGYKLTLPPTLTWVK